MDIRNQAAARAWSRRWTYIQVCTTNLPRTFSCFPWARSFNLVSDMGDGYTHCSMAKTVVPDSRVHATLLKDILVQ